MPPLAIISAPFFSIGRYWYWKKRRCVAAFVGRGAEQLGCGDVAE